MDSYPISFNGFGLSPILNSRNCSPSTSFACFLHEMIQNDEQQHRECVREGAKVFDWPSHAIVDRLNVGLTIAEE